MPHCVSIQISVNNMIAARFTQLKLNSLPRSGGWRITKSPRQRVCPSWVSKLVAIFPEPSPPRSHCLSNLTYRFVFFFLVVPGSAQVFHDHSICKSTDVPLMYHWCTRNCFSTSVSPGKRGSFRRESISTQGIINKIRNPQFVEVDPILSCINTPILLPFMTITLLECGIFFIILWLFKAISSGSTGVQNIKLNYNRKVEFA